MAAKKKRPRGRPTLPKGQDRGVVLTLRLQVGERASLQKAAKKADKSLSAWAREILLRESGVG